VIIKLPNPLTWLKGKQEIPDLTQAGKFDHALDADVSAETSTSAKAVESVMTSFFSRLKSAIGSMWHKLPAMEVAIASAVNNLVPVVEKLDVIILGPDALILNPILDKIKVGLSALKDTIQSAGDKANLTSIVGSVQQHLGDLVAAAQVKNPALAEKIKEVTDVVAAEVTNIHASAGV
jgi:hypothetical protein